MQAELGQPSELLLHGQLHVMSGDAFVVGYRFVVDKRAFSKIGSGNHDAAGALAVRGAGNVVSCSGGLERGYGFNRDRRLGKQIEKPRKLWLHLGNVVAEIVEDLLRRSRNVLRVGLKRGPERDKIGEASLLG